MPAPIPEAFVPLDEGGYIAHCAEFFVHRQLPVLGMRVAPEHLNTMGLAHGGLLAAMADIALAVTIRRSSATPIKFFTLSLGIDYIGAVPSGAWVEASVDIRKSGRRVVNAICTIRSAGKEVLHASGVFLMADAGAAGGSD